MILALTALVFVVSLALSISAFYFFVEVPASKKAMVARLEAIQQVSASSLIDPETELLREEILSHMPALNKLLFQIPLLVRLNLFRQQAGVRITVAFLLTISLFLAFLGLLAGLMLRMPEWLDLMFMVGAGSIPFLVVAFKRKKRFSQFEEQFPDAIDLLARAVRAGHAFTTGLELIAGEMAEPVAGEFSRTYDQQNLGLPLREALQNLLVRMPLPDVQVFVTALIIQRETGGNLAEILDNLSHVIRERFKLMRQIKVFTAQGRMSLYMLVSIPPFVALVMYLINRQYILTLFTDPLGQRALGIAVVLQILGYLVIRKIIQPKL